MRWCSLVAGRPNREQDLLDRHAFKNSGWVYSYSSSERRLINLTASASAHISDAGLCWAMSVFDDCDLHPVTAQPEHEPGHGTPVLSEKIMLQNKSERDWATRRKGDTLSMLARLSIPRPKLASYRSLYIDFSRSVLSAFDRGDRGSRQIDRCSLPSRFRRPAATSALVRHGRRAGQVNGGAFELPSAQRIRVPPLRAFPFNDIPADDELIVSAASNSRPSRAPSSTNQPVARRS